LNQKIEELRPILTIGSALQLKDETEDDTITTFINDPCSISDLNQKILESVLSCETQESIGAADGFEELPTATPNDSVSMEIELGKTLNINPKLSDAQKK